MALFSLVSASAANAPDGINSTVPVSDTMGTYPAGKIGIGAAGTYTCPVNKTIAKVVVSIYEQGQGGNLTYLGDAVDSNPAAGKYGTTNWIVADKTKKYTGISVMFVNAPNPANPPVMLGVTGSFINYSP